MLLRHEILVHMGTKADAGAQHVVGQKKAEHCSGFLTVSNAQSEQARKPCSYTSIKTLPPSDRVTILNSKNFHILSG